MGSPGARMVVLGVGAAYAIALALLAIYLVRDVLVLIFIAWIVAAALRPPVDFLSRRLPRPLAVAVVYLLALLSFAGLLLVVVPPLVVQLAQLVRQLPGYLAGLQQGFVLLQAWLAQYGLSLDLAAVMREGAQLADDTLRALLFVPLAALRFTVGALVVLVVSVYWLLLRERALEWCLAFLPRTSAERARQVFERAEAQMGAYVRGLAVLSLAVGGLTLIGLVALGVPFALALAVVAGILELLPNIGPVLSAVPAVIVAATQSPLLAAATAGLYVVVQQLENYVLVPKVHERAVGLSPLAVLLALLLGASLAGLVGALLAVPVAALVKLVVEDWREQDLQAPGKPTPSAGQG